MGFESAHQSAPGGVIVFRLRFFGPNRVNQILEAVRCGLV
jgi:hypothetical protein